MLAMWASLTLELKQIFPIECLLLWYYWVLKTYQRKCPALISFVKFRREGSMTSTYFNFKVSIVQLYFSVYKSLSYRSCADLKLDHLKVWLLLAVRAGRVPFHLLKKSFCVILREYVCYVSCVRSYVWKRCRLEFN